MKYEVGKAWWYDEEKEMIQIEVNPRSGYTVEHHCVLELSVEEAQRLFQHLKELLA